MGVVPGRRREGGQLRFGLADPGHLRDRPDQLLRGGDRLGVVRRVVEQGPRGELGQALVDPGADLVRSGVLKALRQALEVVAVLRVRPAVGERGEQQGADRAGVGALGVLGRPLGGQPAQGGVHRDAVDPVLTAVGAQHAARGEPQVGLAAAVGGRDGVGDLADHLVRLVRLHRAVGEQPGQVGGVRQPLPDDVDQLALLDGVQDLDEARVAEQGGGLGRGQHLAGPLVAGGHQVDADGPAQLLVDGAPAAEGLGLGDALLQPVPVADHVAAAALRRGEGARERGGVARVDGGLRVGGEALGGRGLGGGGRPLPGGVGAQFGADLLDRERSGDLRGLLGDGGLRSGGPRAVLAGVGGGVGVGVGA